MTPKQRQELWQIIAEVRDGAPRLPNDASTDDVIDAIIDSGWLERLEHSDLNRTRQYGVQVVWTNPVHAGAVKKGESYEPEWSVFAGKGAADKFTRYFQAYVGAESPNGVKELNRAERWSSEQYGEWEPV